MSACYFRSVLGLWSSCVLCIFVFFIKQKSTKQNQPNPQPLCLDGCRCFKTPATSVHGKTRNPMCNENPATHLYRKPRNPPVQKNPQPTYTDSPILRHLDLEYKTYIGEQNPLFDWKLMPTIKELAGEALESFVDKSQNELLKKRENSLMARFEEWEYRP
jgi:hypothetical protein